MKHLSMIIILLFFSVSLCPAVDSSLIDAANAGNLQLVKKLLTNGADINAKDDEGYTALMWAAYNGHGDVVKELLANGADINAKDNEGYTALMWADEQGHTEIVQLLKKAGKTGKSAQTSAKSNDNQAPAKSNDNQTPVKSYGDQMPAKLNVDQATEKSDGWSTHSDPNGFCVNKPAGWNMTNDPKTGYIVIQGTQGEKAVIWPMFIEQQRLDAHGASAVVQQLAHTVNPELPWGAAEVSGSFVRVVARQPQRIGATMMTWAPAQNGTSIFMYSLAAPPDVYHRSVDTFMTILGSFRIVKAQEASGPVGMAGNMTTPTPASFINWSDPRDGAFSVSIPQGWKVSGGSYRLSALDVRMSVALVSPDGAVRVTVGDSNLGAYTLPTQMYAMTGFREGSMTSLSDGTQLQIRRLISGQQFAREYVERFVKQICPDLRVTSNNPRPDLTQVYLQQAHADGYPNAQLTAGDASFVGSLNGKEVKGSYFAATCLPLPDKGQLWYVYRIYGYLAPPERQQEAETICKHVMDSWVIDPQWRQKEKQIAAAAVQADNIRSQQIQQRALQAIAEDQRQTSDIISSSYWQRQKVYDEISRKRENAILGTVDVVDPSSNTQYKVNYNSDYHWMDNQGNILGTLTDTSPGAGWRKMIDLP